MTANLLRTSLAAALPAGLAGIARRSMRRRRPKR